MGFLGIAKGYEVTGRVSQLMDCLHYFDSGNSFMDISISTYMSILIKLYSLNMCRLLSENYNLIKQLAINYILCNKPLQV